MAYPTKPERDYSYTSFQESQGDNSFPGTQLDNDLANLKQAIDETIDFTASVIRSDGKLGNGVVAKSSLDESILLGIAPPRAWETGGSYAVDETIFTANALYICVVAHTAGVFASDLAAGRWQAYATFTPLTDITDGTVTTPKVVDGAITGPKVADGAITGPKVADGTLTKAKLAAALQAMLLPVGISAPWDGPIAPAGWVFKFGQRLSRVTYGALMDALTAVALGNVVSGSLTISGVGADLRNLGLEGSPIEGAGIPGGTTLAAVTATTVTLSQNASATVNGAQIRIFPHGAGDGSTTFTVPDDRDVAGIGRGNMGGTARGLVSTAGAGAPNLNTARLGATGGVDRHAISLAQIPNLAPAGVADGAGVLVGQTNTLKAFGVQLGSGATAYGTGAGSDVNIPVSVADVTRGLTIGALGGGGQAHPNMQPSRATNSIIFTGVV